jgi:peptide/nickel transport system ATP-binding protein
VTLLEVDGLGVEVKRYGKWVRVVDDVSFSIASGETMGLVGESGSGKSLTAAAVMNLLPQSVRLAAGTVNFEGRVVSALAQRDFRQLRGPKMAMVFQDPQNSLNPAYTVGNQMVEALRTHHEMSKRDATTRAVELLARVGIKHPRDRLGDYPHQFSGGMAQRVMIALAISSQPKLLIADEPTTALDVTVQAQILRLLHSLREEFGMSLLLISHDLSVIAEMCDRVAVMYAGQLVETGDVRSVFVSPTHPYTEALLGSHPGPHTKGGQLLTIPGTVPDPSAMPEGCRFHTRCKYVMEKCIDAPPPLVERGGTEVRCVRVGEILLAGVRAETSAKTHALAERTARDPLLVVGDLTKEYAVGGGVFGRAKRTIRAVDDETIDVQPGESVGLVGESGAGKTTVGRLVLGLVAPTSGKVEFQGVDRATLSRRALRTQRRDIQVIYQNPYASLDPLMTVGDTIAEPLDIHVKMADDERKQRIIELLSQVGLDETYRFRYPHQLSGGQRQRVAIARALALKPKLIVCDEPISSLDVSTQAQVINLLNQLKDETGIAYLFVGHDLEVVHHISDRVAVMYLGRVVEWGPSDEVYANPRHPYTRMLLGSVLSTDPTSRRLFTMADDTGVQEAPPPGGCPFAPRCPDAIDDCLTTDPPPVHVRGVSVRCIRVAPDTVEASPQRSAV